MIASFLFVGYLPAAPGTWGSLAGALWAWYFPSMHLFSTVVFSILGLAVCAPARRVFRSDDPKLFVMDEVSGMLISLLWLPRTFAWYAASFFLFRVFDVLKPGPIGAIQKNRAPWSIMGDDMLAGVLVNLALHSIQILFKLP